MKLSIGISPCPNDTFIFDALLHQKIDTKGIEFDLHLADVEELNLRAINHEFDITKVSYHALSQCTDDYHLLSAGSALGRNCGPLLISKQPLSKSDLSTARIAIPGDWTTAHFLLKYYAPEEIHKSLFLFSDIEEAIHAGEVEAGVIIHENRFTYKERGFHLIQDLGEYWEQETNYPIPLGGIAIKKSLPMEVQRKVNQLIQESLQYAWNQKDLPEFVSCNAQEMSPEVMRQHIQLYVNKYTYDLGTEGEQAVRYLMNSLYLKHPLKIIQTMEEHTVSIYCTREPFLIHHLANHLENSGIEFRITGDTATTVFGIENITQESCLWVFQKDVIQAKQILEPYLPKQ